MFAGLRNAGLEERLRNTPAGLASSLRLAGTGTQAPLWDRLGESSCRCWCWPGRTTPGSRPAGSTMASSLADAVFSLVPGAGHAAHLPSRRLTARLVERFLASDDH